MSLEIKLGFTDMESSKCPITQETFEDPVIGEDGHTYERKAIINWLTKKPTSPFTGQPINVNTLRPNHLVKQMIEELRNTSPSHPHTLTSPSPSPSPSPHPLFSLD